MWRGCLFDNFLIATLQRAVALTECNYATGTVAENLHFDVAGLNDALLEINAAVGEVGSRQAFDRGKRFGQFVSRGAGANTDAPASGRALQHYRIANAISRLAGFIRIPQQ